jgi:hypothetical protein
MYAIAKWIRRADNVEGLMAVCFGVLLTLQPMANSFHNSIASVTIGFLFIWLGLFLVSTNPRHEMFFTSVILRTLHAGALLIDASRDLSNGDLLIVVIAVGSIVYALVKKLDEIEGESTSVRG